jgi:hypothetical protein
MRKELLAMASATALGLAIGISPAGALQIAPGVGVTDANLIQVGDRGGHGGGRSGGSVNIGGGNRGGSSGFSGHVGGRSSADFGGRSGSDFRVQGEARGSANFKAQSDNRGNLQFNRGDDRPRASVRDGKPDGDGKWSGKWDGKKDGKWSDRGDWDGKLKHRGRSKHGHVFFGAFLLGVPYGYATVASHPCYDWTFGPNGWGYYWNHYRCPV